MSSSVCTKRSLWAISLILCAVSAAWSAPATEVAIEARSSDLGTIRGVVRDEGGSPIADATVAIFRGTTSLLLKQVSSNSDGSFVARIMPGTYSVLAVAQGFNPVTIMGVEVGRSSDLSYGIKLERSGGGNTLPEKRSDKNSSKWRIRAAQMSRSIYQNQDGNVPIDETAVAEEAEPRRSRKTETVVETYFADGRQGSFSGLNFATLVPIGDDSQIVLAAQTGVGKAAPQRFDTALTFVPASGHKVRLSGGVAKLTNFSPAGDQRRSEEHTSELQSH